MQATNRHKNIQVLSNKFFCNTSVGLKDIHKDDLDRARGPLAPRLWKGRWQGVGRGVGMALGVKWEGVWEGVWERPALPRAPATRHPMLMI